MLKYMRDHLGKTFFAIIVGGISLVFIVSGVFPETRWGMRGMTGNDVASVGGEKITAKELQAAVSREVENYRAMGIDLPKELMDNVKLSALNNLVSQKLMLIEAKHLGIAASDKEVMQEIQRLPYFQDKEKKTFSVELYRQLLAANNLSPAQFEANVRDSLTNQRMVQFLEARIRVTDKEVEREYQVSNETRNLSFVRLTREDAMKKLKVTDAELEAFMKSKDAELAITSHYAQNNHKYNAQETVCARHILKRVPPSEKAAAATGAAVPKDFLALKPTPANFETLAKKSDDPGTKDKGGDLGCFPKGAMDKAFEQMAFSTPVGKVSAPVLSAFGWHYILVYKKKPAVSIPLEQVRREIAEELVKRQRVDEIRKINFEIADSIAKSWPPKGYVVETTGSFNGLEGNIPKIGRADEILKASFDPAAKIQKGPQVFESQGSVIVAVIKDKKSANMSELKNNKDMQLRTLKERKLRAFMPAWMEDVRGRVKISYNNGILEQM